MPIRKLYDLLSNRERKVALVLFFMMILMAMAEAMGVISVMPFLAVAADPQIIYKNPILFWLFREMHFESLMSFMFFLGGLFITVYFLSGGIRALTTYFIIRYVEGRTHTLSCRLLSLYVMQPYEFFLNKNSAHLIKNILSEVLELTHTVMRSLLYAISHAFACFMLLGLLLFVSPIPVLVVGLIFGGAYTLVYWKSRNHLVKAGVKRLEGNKDRFVVASEVFGGIKEIKLLGGEKTYITRFEAPSLKYVRGIISQEFIKLVPRYVMESLVFAAVIGITLYFLSTKGNLQEFLPTMGVYVLAGYRLMPSLQQIFQNSVSVRHSLPVLDSLTKEFQQLQKKEANSTKARLHPLKRILVDRVTYTYPKCQTATLTDINLDIPIGGSLGIVGTTGAGKTTLVDLLLGLLIPTKGRILSDDVAIGSQNLRQWQNILGYVPQNIYLADDSIAANIAFALDRSEIDMERVKKAARAANLHAFVETQLPNAYQTVVGERGIRISGGQRQRIGIARALYRDPQILVFDEATSALDNLTEKEVISAVNNLKGQITIIVIAHRLSTVRKCDEIVMLDRGRIVSAGTYETLIDSNEQFRAMVAEASGSDSNITL